MKVSLVKLPDRKNTNSIKWDFIRAPSNFKTLRAISSFDTEKPIIPMWVADMDFECPKEVIEALEERVRHGIYGYTMASVSYYDSIVEWMDKRRVDPDR